MPMLFYGRTIHLSIYAKAEKTIIEGVTYFDIERDQTNARSHLKKKKANLLI